MPSEPCNSNSGAESPISNALTDLINRKEAMAMIKKERIIIEIFSNMDFLPSLSPIPLHLLDEFR